MDKNYMTVCVEKIVFSKKLGDSDEDITFKNICINGTVDDVRKALEDMVFNFELMTMTNFD